jgi:mitochondrial enoyl-[acyl-carrier protein] reductase / trans-2-enoyl-CoA reductase
MARHCGHRTVNVVRRDDADAVAREAGGDVVLVDGEDLTKRVTEMTDGAEVPSALMRSPGPPLDEWPTARARTRH